MNDKPRKSTPRTEITKDRTIESIVRAQLFSFKNPRERFKKAYELCDCKTLDPYAIFMARSLDLIKLLAGPLSSRPGSFKNIMAGHLLNVLLSMRGAMDSSATAVDSLVITHAKTCEMMLHNAKVDMDALCGVGYFTTKFYSKLYDILVDLDRALEQWFQILKTHVDIKQGKLKP